MNRKLIIIICVAVILVAIIVGVCIVVSSGNSASSETVSGWTALENSSSNEVNWKNDSKGRMLLRITGDFSKDAFAVDAGDAFSVSVDGSKTGKVTYVLEGLIQGTNNIIISSGTDSTAEKYTLTASYDGTAVSPVNLSYVSAETQVFSGDIEGYAYTLTNDGSQMTLRITGGDELNCTILHGAGNLFAVQNVLDTVEGDAEKDTDVPQKTAEINYDEEDTAAAAAETEAPAEESASGTPSDVSFVFTAQTSGYEALRVCSTDLTHAIEIGASAEMDGYITVDSVDVIDYTYTEADTSALTDYESSVYALIVGEDMVPSDITISGSSIIFDPETEAAMNAPAATEPVSEEASEAETGSEETAAETVTSAANDNSYSIGVLELYLYSEEWNYAVTGDLDEAELVNAINSAAKEGSDGTAGDVTYTVYTAATGVYVSFICNDNACLVYSTETTDSDSAVRAATTVISALEKD